MSSTQESSSPYKSRLFNFFNRQYLKVNSSLGISVRQFTQTVNTGIATILYPFYVLLKNTKKITNIFSPSAESQKTTQLNQTQEKISSDYILEQVSEQVTNIPEVPKLRGKSVQGLANLIENKKMVIAKPNNQTKVVFSYQQTQAIDTIISKIVGEYQTKKELLLIGKSEAKKQINSSKNNVGSLLNFFGHRKISRDLEQIKNSELAENNSQKIFTEESPPPNKILLFIDQVFIKIENGTLTVFKKEHSDITSGHNTEEISQDKSPDKNYLLRLIEAAINYFFTSDNKQSLGINASTKDEKTLNDSTSKNNNVITSTNHNQEINQAIQGIVNQTQEILPVIQAQTEKLMVKGLSQASVVKNKFNAVINHDDNPLNIQALIWAAIDYFFNVKLNKDKPLTFSQTTEELLLIDGQISDPWLSWEDLYGEKKPSILEDNINKINDSHIVINPPSESDLQTVEDNSKNKGELIIEKELDNEIITFIEEKEFNDVQKHPSEGEIEAKVITIGYDKHFLEIILEKLDTVILALEELILKIIGFCQSLIKKILKSE
ncbi:hypothetical protein Cyast_0698 [Cyanobacterium stanieri PCC 7202]|uniref:Uncharacterized protein n=1 Tax=Cyanobacterium stanieri (strain ATCC 29140 / PCC 7202) TaxID=292563 RepID=K9YKR3_CYASC|nr:hypothetical protein Cyast_0698 [Cyanobacterium stanieri PCC 7202]